jgi:hypothetical protein
MAAKSESISGKYSLTYSTTSWSKSKAKSSWRLASALPAAAAARGATTDKVKDPRREANALKLETAY